MLNHTVSNDCNFRLLTLSYVPLMFNIGDTSQGEIFMAYNVYTYLQNCTGKNCDRSSNCTNVLNWPFTLRLILGLVNVTPL